MMYRHKRGVISRRDCGDLDVTVSAEKAVQVTAPGSRRIIKVRDVSQLI